MDPVRHPHDALFRLVFGDPGRAAELIRSALPPQLARAIDWGSLRRREESFVDEELRGHHADLLFEVRVARHDALLYVLVEHKSATDRFATFQLLRYVVRVLERWRREHPRARSLPLVLPYVLHHGARPWAGPRRLSELLDLRGLSTEAARELRALQPQLAFVLDDLATQDEATIRARVHSAVSAITLFLLRAAQRGELDLLEVTLTRWRETLAEVVAHGTSVEILGALYSFLLATAKLEPATVRSIVPKVLPKPVGDAMTNGLEKLIQQYRAEGLVEGSAEGQRRMLLRLLDRRFGPLSQDTFDRVQVGTPDDLERWADRVLTARTLEDVFAD